MIVSLGSNSCDIPLPTCIVDFLTQHRLFRFCVLASYLGAFTYLIRSFFQTINNFDLMPASFFGAFNNFIFGNTLPAVLFLFFGHQQKPVVEGVLIATFFVLGYMPDAALRFLLQRTVVKFFKGERSIFGVNGKSVTIEVLDGIDSLVRYRLSDFHLTTVQNLASANPIMLFVETPYGIYQIIDWVAQAQLCASVGPDRLFALWDLGIRTIFDLERVGLHPTEFVNDRLLWAIDQALFVKRSTSRQTPDVDLLNGIPVNWDPKPVVANIRMRIDNIYTQRLRQIVNRVSDQIGGDETRLLRKVSNPGAPQQQQPGGSTDEKSR